jgi:hypothetical protein
MHCTIQRYVNEMVFKSIINKQTDIYGGYKLNRYWTWNAQRQSFNQKVSRLHDSLLDSNTIDTILWTVLLHYLYVHLYSYFIYNVKCHYLYSSVNAIEMQQRFKYNTQIAFLVNECNFNCKIYTHRFNR